MLVQAVKCIGRGAQLHALVSRTTETSLQAAEWGATLVQQYKRLGAQLHGLKELEVRGDGEALVSALSAVASSAPSLTRLKIDTKCSELPPICSGSLESIVLAYYGIEPMASPSPIILTLLPGCLRLQEVLVRYFYAPRESSVVSIRCYCSSPSCIVPLHVGAGLAHELGVQFLPVAPSTEVMRDYTVVFACHAAGPKQPLKWGHVVCPVASGVYVYWFLGRTKETHGIRPVTSHASDSPHKPNGGARHCNDCAPHHYIAMRMRTHESPCPFVHILCDRVTRGIHTHHLPCHVVHPRWVSIPQLRVHTRLCRQGACD